MYKLLVVDDEYESRNTLCSCFPWNETGFQIVAQLDNGKATLDYLRETMVDVILCDIKMPVMSGIDLAKELHNKKQKPMIIFLSGYREFDYAQKAMAFGARYYIIKPARYEELMEIFTELKKELDDKLIKEDSGSLQNKSIKKIDSANITDKLICTVKKYIDENYATASLEEASKIIHMNASYLSQFFKQKTGYNFSDYLIQVRMNKAAELLENIDLKTYDVSEMIGYTNAKNFTRTFKAYFGMSPRDFRNSKYS